MKTVKQYLEELQDQEHREKALKNLDFEKRNDTANSLEHSLSVAFRWHRTPEGYKFWHNIHAALVGNDPLD